MNDVVHELPEVVDYDQDVSMSTEQPSTNDLGPIAESYDDLQCMAALFAAVRHEDSPAPGSAWQATQAFFQAAEISIIATVPLVQSATASLVDGQLSDTLRALDWMNAFGTTWLDLAWRVKDVTPEVHLGGTEFTLDISESPNWHEVQESEAQFSTLLLPLVEGETARSVDEALRLRLLRYTMLQRIALEYCFAEGAPASYENLVRPIVLRKAMHHAKLTGNTVFLQFRAAHQASEILVNAVNDHLEAAIIFLYGSEGIQAINALRRVDRLLDATVSTVEILANNLQTGEYHRIRKNLGLTSGSHSVGLHYHLMRDLHPELKNAAARFLSCSQDRDLAHAVQSYVRSISIHLDRWRLIHLNLPRNNLGGAGTGTRSLIGAGDAADMVGRMRERSRSKLSDTGGSARLAATDCAAELLALGPVERALLQGVADLTQARFPDVQNRSGYFAGGSAFRPPPRRGAIRRRSAK